MNLLILTSKKRFDCYENLRLIEEAKNHNINIQLTIPENYELVVGDSLDSEKIFYDQKLIKNVDVFLPRYSLSYFTQIISRYFERRQKTLVLNSASARALAKDKLMSLQKLSYKNMPIPKSILARFPLNIKFIEKQIKYPLIVKKSEGSEGKGIILCENRTQLEDLLEMLEDSADTKNQNFILQEFISEKKGQDLRVFVIGGRAIGAMLRKGKNGDFKANYSGGGSVKPYKLNPEIEWLAVESANIMGLDIAGVDILFDKNGYRICEVNASPYFEGFEKATGINVPVEIFNYIKVRHSLI